MHVARDRVVLSVNPFLEVASHWQFGWTGPFSSSSGIDTFVFCHLGGFLSITLAVNLK